MTHWDEVLRLRRAVIKVSDPDDIHDLRTASRRFRAALELYYPFAPKELKSELRKSVRKLTRILGRLRNIDESRIFFQSRIQADLPVTAVLYSGLSELRSIELKRIVKALKAFEHGHLDRIVREIVNELARKRLAKRNRSSLLAYFSEVSIRQYLPIHQLLAVAQAPGQVASRHALRIAIKKWRYSLEIMAQVLRKDYTPILDLLKEYQSLLGRMNDLVEFGALLRNLDLSREGRNYLKAILRTEDTLLLESFNKLVEQKPLNYTFLI